MDNREQTTTVTLEEITTEFLPGRTLHSIHNVQLVQSPSGDRGVHISLHEGELSIVFSARVKIGRALAALGGSVAAFWTAIEFLEWIITRLRGAGP